MGQNIHGSRIKNGTISGSSFSSSSPFSASTIYSGSTDLSNLFARLGASGSGDVTGPGSSTDNAIVRFDGTGGKTIQNSTAVIDDSGNLTVEGGITLKGTRNILANIDSGSVILGGDSGTTAGAIVRLFGGAHTSLPSVGRLQVGSSSILTWQTGGVSVTGGLSATTFYSGSTDLSNLFARSSQASQWITTGTNIYYSSGSIGIGSNATNPTTGEIVIDKGTNVSSFINWKSGSNTGSGGFLVGIDGQGNASINNRESKTLTLSTSDQAAIVISSSRAVQFSTYGRGIIVSDSSGNLTSSLNLSATSISSTTISAGTIYSGSTDISNLFARIGETGGGTFTGGTVSGFSTFQNGLSATTISATTIYSGSTDLSNLFARLGTTSQWTTSGNNIYYNSGVVSIGTSSGALLSGVFRVDTTFAQTDSDFKATSTSTTTVTRNGSSTTGQYLGKSTYFDIQGAAANTGGLNTSGLFEAKRSGAGSLTNLSALRVYATSTATGGTITNMHAFHVSLNNDAGGTITNAYGIYIPSFGGSGTYSNKYSIYSLDSNGLFYHVGPVRVTNSISATTIYSGSTDLSDLFARLGTAGGSGDVSGPSSSLDNAIVRFDGTGGKTIQNSTVLINDSGTVLATGLSATTVTGITVVSDTYKNTAGNTNVIFNNVGSANYFGFYNGGAGTSPKILAAGSDTNLNLHLESKGTGYVYFSTNTAIRLPEGTTAQRPTAATGMIRYNTTNSKFEGYESSSWKEIGTHWVSSGSNIHFSENVGIGAGAYNPTSAALVLDDGTNNNVYINWRSGTNTGSGGLLVGIDGQGNAVIQNRENKKVEILTNDQVRLGVANDGLVTFNKWINLASTAAASTLTEGAIWNDSTIKAFRVYVNSVTGSLSTLLFTKTADSTITNSTSETDLVGTGIGTITLPANFFVVGKTLRIRASGTIAQTGFPNLTLRVRLGGISGTDILTNYGQNISDVTGTAVWTLEGDISCRSVGASGSAVAAGTFTFFKTAVSATTWSLVPNWGAGQAMTIDTTVSKQIVFSAQWSAADTGNTFTVNQLSIEALN